jgi:selT/selW/selH-like putative selenoprotein
VKPRLVKGSGGVFEVRLGGQPIFSKKAAGRFPEPGEVMGLLQQKLPASS